MLLHSAGADGLGVILLRGDLPGRQPQKVRETMEDVVASGSTAQVQSILASVQPRMTWPVREAGLTCMPKSFADCSCDG